MTAEGRKKQKRTTMPSMTKYERARIIGTRALQISMNAPVMVRKPADTQAAKKCLFSLLDLRSLSLLLLFEKFVVCREK
jgi:hypothetical protein